MTGEEIAAKSSNKARAAFRLNLVPLAFAAYFLLSAAYGDWFAGLLIKNLVLATVVIPVWGSGYLLTGGWSRLLWPLTWFVANAAMWVGNVMADEAGEPLCINSGLFQSGDCYYTNTAGFASYVFLTGIIVLGIAILTAKHASRLAARRGLDY